MMKTLLCILTGLFTLSISAQPIKPTMLTTNASNPNQFSGGSIKSGAKLTNTVPVGNWDFGNAGVLQFGSYWISNNFNGDGSLEFWDQGNGAGASFINGTWTASFAGGGSGLTSLNASQLGSGTVPTARMSALGSQYPAAVTNLDTRVLTLVNALIGTNATVASAGTWWFSNWTKGTLIYFGTNTPGNGKGTDIANGFIGGSNVLQIDILGTPKAFCIDSNANSYFAGTLNIGGSGGGNPNWVQTGYVSASNFFSYASNSLGYVVAKGYAATTNLAGTAPVLTNSISVLTTNASFLWLAPINFDAGQFDYQQCSVLVTNSAASGITMTLPANWVFSVGSTNGVNAGGINKVVFECYPNVRSNVTSVQWK